MSVNDVYDVCDSVMKAKQKDNQSDLILLDFTSLSYGHACKKIHVYKVHSLSFDKVEMYLCAACHALTLHVDARKN